MSRKPRRIIRSVESESRCLARGILRILAESGYNPDLVILLMTAYADQRQRAGLDARIHDVITKPFTLAEIKVAVNEALATRRGA